MDSLFFTRNRQRLSEIVMQHPAAFSANSLIQSQGDSAATCVQESNFWWLTGIEEPDWILVIEGSQSYLIAPDIDEIHRIFDGSLTNDEARNISGVDEVITSDEGKELLVRLAALHGTVFSLGKDPSARQYGFRLNPGPVNFLTSLNRVFEDVKDCRIDLARLRAIKQPQEVDMIRSAVELTIDAFNHAKESIASYDFEYEVEADFTHRFRRSGAKGHAYDPIVAASKNACTLHYIKNDAQLKSGDLLLLDIGARVGGYAADITRTYAIGNVSDRHKAVHAAVENAHRKIIALLGPGVSVKQYSEDVDVIMKDAIAELGLLKQDSDYRKYFPHAISHGLGVDVHDSLGGPEAFLTGMVLTVEPGIYIPEESIGVRIEDDILITETGHENLSGRLPISL